METHRVNEHSDKPWHEWRPASELPEPFQRVLVAVVLLNLELWRDTPWIVMEATHDGYVWCEMVGEEGKDYKVTHWMPLPPLPGELPVDAGKDAGLPTLTSLRGSIPKDAGGSADSVAQIRSLHDE